MEICGSLSSPSFQPGKKSTKLSRTTTTSSVATQEERRSCSCKRTKSSGWLPIPPIPTSDNKRPAAREYRRERLLMTCVLRQYRSELLLCALIAENVISPLADSCPLFGALLAALVLLLL